MWPWVALLVTPLIMRIGYDKRIFLSIGYKKNINLGYVLTFLILFIFRAFRNDSVGGDLATYKKLFYYTGPLPWDKALEYPGYEKGFLFLIKILYRIKPDFQILLLFTAILFSFSLLKFISDNSKLPWFSLYIYITMYFFSATFNNERQAIAISFLFFGFKYIKERKFWHFLFFILLAATFHLTSIIFIVLYFMYEWDISEKYCFTMMIVGIMSYIFSKPILMFVISRFYTKYAGVTGFGGSGYGYFIFLLIIVLPACLLLRGKSKENNDGRIFIHMLVIAVIIQIFTFQLGFIYRAVRLFSVAIIFYLPDVTYLFRDKISRRVTNQALCTLLIVYYIYCLNNDMVGVVPYKLM